MKLLAGVNYDPAVEVAKSTATRIAMTAFDTTNLRLVFTAPASGNVLVRICCTLLGATTFPTILLGVLQGSTIIARHAPQGSPKGTNLATTFVVQEALFVVTGLTGGASYTWDAAYGVEILLASTNIRYGGPNNTTGGNARGGIQFEIWEAPNLLGAKNYDPASAVTKSTASLLAMTALDTTNLRITFTAPQSGSVLVRLKCIVHGATTYPQILLGVMESTAVIGRSAGIGANKVTNVSTAQWGHEATFIVKGLTPSGSYTWDAAYAVQLVIASTGIKYGGPNDTTTNNAFGAFVFEIWGA